MWTRKELKKRGKAAFKANYWRCVLVALIVAAIGAAAGGAGGRSAAESMPDTDPGETITLIINCDPEGPNTALFKYNQDRYFRIGAQAGGNGYNGNSAFNFSKTYKVSADFSSITPVEWPAL